MITPLYMGAPAMPMHRLEKSVLSLCTVLALFVHSLPAQAWWDLGHTSLCDVAYSLVTAKTRETIDRLSSLSDNTGLLKPERFAKSCTWADRIKKDQPHTRTWHYLNSQPGDTSITQIRRPNDGDIMTALASQLAVLSNKNANSVERAIALRWVGHLVGDLHQPMHLGYETDWGGNKYRMSMPPSIREVLHEDRRKTTNMHAVWDGYLLIYATHKRDGNLKELIGQPVANHVINIDEWANEVLALLQMSQLRYATTDRLDELSEAYLADNADTAVSQVNLAAHRLALLLDAALNAPSRKAY